MEWCFPMEHMWKRNFLFPLIWNFRFYYRPMAALYPNYQTIHNDTLSKMSRMYYLSTKFYYHTPTQLDPIRNCHVLQQYYPIIPTQPYYFVAMLTIPSICLFFVYISL